MAGRLKHTILHPVFITVTLLSAGNKALEFYGISIPFIHAYMDDVFCMPFVLTLTLLVMRKYVVHADYTLSKWQITAAVFYCSLLFEVALPYYSTQYTPDIADIAAYSIGAFIFHFFINKPQAMPSVSRAERKISSASSLV